MTGIDEVGVKLDARIVRAEKYIIPLRSILRTQTYSSVLFALILLPYSTLREVHSIQSNFLVVIPR